MSGFAKRGASALWRIASRSARALVAAGLLKQTRLPGRVRVISVGNIQAGGAGKTPLVAQIAREAASRGIQVAILCRGYKSAWEVSGGTIFPGDPAPKTALCGDEPALLHDLAPDAIIGVGADRIARFSEIQRGDTGKPLLVILDDGFQHWKIARDLDVVAITSAGPGEVYFREGKEALRHADLLIWTKGDRRPESLGRPLVRVRFALPSAKSAEAIHLVTGVADFRDVRQGVERAGYRVLEHSICPDHATYEPGWVQCVIQKSREAGNKTAITGKDWVKWREAGISRDELIVLEPELVFEEGRELWEKLLWG